ncbi:TIGR03943 family protein [Longispora sp. NPDC051575]|uniref:TIGR03943 family putative permease subunit n=1 Tax=Longispora sp. NPDC051575 TaxID=3154943 RepID=UPI003430B903
MNRAAESVVVALVGGAVLRISLTDQYLSYVREGLRPFLVAAGVLLLATAGATLRSEVFGRRRPADPHGTDPGQVEPVRAGAARGGHGHAHGRTPVAWLLVLPVVALVLVGPRPLGADAAGRAGTALGSRADADFPPLTADDPARVGLLDYASRAVFDQGRTLDGRRVLLTGFTTDGPGGEVQLTRMILTCCAADARPVKVGLAGDVPGGLAPDTWIEVVGRYSSRTARDPVNGETVPYLLVESFREVPAPARAYE